MASTPNYADKLKKLSDFIGMRMYTALAPIVEPEAFERFAKAEQYASS